MLKPNFNGNSSRQVLLRLDYNNCLYCIVLNNTKKKRKEGEKKKKLLLQVLYKCMNNTNSIVIENMIFLSYNLCNLQFIQKSRGLTIMSLHFTTFIYGM